MLIKDNHKEYDLYAFLVQYEVIFNAIIAIKLCLCELHGNETNSN